MGHFYYLRFTDEETEAQRYTRVAQGHPAGSSVPRLVLVAVHGLPQGSRARVAFASALAAPTTKAFLMWAPLKTGSNRVAPVPYVSPIQTAWLPLKAFCRHDFRRVTLMSNRLGLQTFIIG